MHTSTQSSRVDNMGNKTDKNCNPGKSIKELQEEHNEL